jgi:NADH-quinone oxidoreductase subunit J
MELFFYLFAALITVSSLMVVTSKNPVHSVLWLIFAFCNGSGLMILLGAEFLAMMLIIIYVGAVAVLFLFVVMMLDIHFSEARGDFRRNSSFTAFIALLMFIDLAVIIMLGTNFIDIGQEKAFRIPSHISNTEAIGRVLYTDFILPFQTAGIILFVAMIACIGLTLRHKPGVKRQNVKDQLGRSKENSMSLTKPVINSGVSGIKYDK